MYTCKCRYSDLYDSVMCRSTRDTVLKLINLIIKWLNSNVQSIHGVSESKTIVNLSGLELKVIQNAEACTKYLSRKTQIIFRNYYRFIRSIAIIPMDFSHTH